MKPAEQLADAARMLLNAGDPQGPIPFTVRPKDMGQHSEKIATAYAYLATSLRRYESTGQAVRSRLDDEALRIIMLEELQRVLHGTPVHHASVDAMRTAAFAAMRRIAAYADHLHQLLVTLSQTIDLEKLLFTLAEAERRANNLPRIKWDTPSIKPLCDIVAEILSEVKTTEPQKAPVAEHGEDS